MGDPSSHQFMESSKLTNHSRTSIGSYVDHVEDGNEVGVEEGKDCLFNVSSFSSLLHGDGGEVLTEEADIWSISSPAATQQK